MSRKSKASVSRSTLIAGLKLKVKNKNEKTKTKRKNQNQNSQLLQTTQSNQNNKKSNKNIDLNHNKKKRTQVNPSTSSSRLSMSADTFFDICAEDHLISSSTAESKRIAFVSNSSPSSSSVTTHISSNSIADALNLNGKGVKQ